MAKSKRERDRNKNKKSQENQIGLKEAVKENLSLNKKWYKRWNFATVIPLIAAILTSFFLIKGCLDDKAANENKVDIFIGDIQMEDEPFGIIYLCPYLDSIHDEDIGLIPIGLSNPTEKPIDALKLLIGSFKYEYQDKNMSRFLANKFVEIPFPTHRDHQVDISHESVLYSDVSIPTYSKYWALEAFAINEIILPDSFRLTLGNPKLNIVIRDMFPLIGDISYEDKTTKFINSSVVVLDFKNKEDFLKVLVDNKPSFPKLSIKYKPDGKNIKEYILKNFVIIELPPTKIQRAHTLDIKKEDFRYYKMEYNQNGEKMAIKIFDPKLNKTNEYNYIINPVHDKDFNDLKLNWGNLLD